MGVKLRSVGRAARHSHNFYTHQELSANPGLLMMYAKEGETLSKIRRQPGAKEK
jgi:hypothetical protein